MWWRVVSESTAAGPEVGQGWKLRDVPAAPGRGFLPSGQSGADPVEEPQLYSPAAAESQDFHCPLLLMLPPLIGC